MLAAGADPNCVDGRGDTALHRGAKLGHAKAVEALKKFRAEHIPVAAVATGFPSGQYRSDMRCQPALRPQYTKIQFIMIGLLGVFLQFAHQT